MNPACLDSGFKSQKLYAYGFLSTEQAQKSLKVATLELDIDIPLFMTQDGFQKMASIAPCPVFFMKPGFEEKKALFSSAFELETLDFADTQGRQRKVHLQYPFVSFRDEASRDMGLCLTTDNEQ